MLLHISKHSLVNLVRYVLKEILKSHKNATNIGSSSMFNGPITIQVENEANFGVGKCGVTQVWEPNRSGPPPAFATHNF